MARALALEAVFYMASPQPDKFTKISSELLDAMCKLHLTGQQWSVIHAVLRKTYGYNKKVDWVTNTQIAEMCDLGDTRVSEAKTELIKANILLQKGKMVGIQKDYEKWQKLRKTVIKVTENRNSDLRKTVYTIDNIDNRQLGESSSPGLKTNKKDMGWNKYSEDIGDDTAINYDTGETISQVEKPKKKTTPEMKKLFEMFNNPAKKVWHMYKVERDSAQVLIDTYGLETLERRINRIEQEKKKKPDDPLRPLINTPKQLLDKMEAFERYLKHE